MNTRRKKHVVFLKLFLKKAKIFQREVRDPRFDPACGDFDKEKFKKNYMFVNEYKKKETEILKKQLKGEKDVERAEKIKYLIQRNENQFRQAKIDQEKQKEEKAKKEERNKMLREGLKPKFISKSKQKEQDLLKKYETLKDKGGLDKYIEKKQKIKSQKDKKR